jgi:hypothetical protein
VSTPAGWYADPQAAGSIRYWDGHQWTANTAPAVVPPTQHAGDQSAKNAVPQNVSFFGAKKRAEELQRENAELRDQLGRLGGLDAFQVQAEIERGKQEVAKLDQQIQQASRDLVEVAARVELQDVGLYQYHHPAESSVALKNELDSVQALINRCVRDKAAIAATTNFTFNNSGAKGRKFVSDISRIMLRAYNAEAEMSIQMHVSRIEPGIVEIDGHTRAGTRGAWLQTKLGPRPWGVGDGARILVQTPRSSPDLRTLT